MVSSASPETGGTMRSQLHTTTQVVSPMSGTVVALSDVPDPVFAALMIGPGLAILPDEPDGFLRVRLIGEDRQARADHQGGEHRVRHVGQGNDGPAHRRHHLRGGVQLTPHRPPASGDADDTIVPAVHVQSRTGAPRSTTSPGRTRRRTAPGLPCSATTGHSGDRPARATAAGSQRSTAAPAVTSSPMRTSSCNPDASRFTVSTPRCTSTSRPSPRTTRACERAATTTPVSGAQTSPSRGSIARPGPTMPWPKTASGTSARSWTVPATGASTLSGLGTRGSAQGVDVRRERVRLGPDHHLDDPAGAHDAERATGPQGLLVEPAGVS